jgi:uncharacterized protein YmfQ (DUF2313 family)
MSDAANGDERDVRLKRQDCLDVVIDAPADNVVRPCRPERRKQLIAEWEKLVRYGAIKVPPKSDTGKPRADSEGPPA